MNKFLLGTTALVAASAFAAPAMSAERIQLQLRGYHVGGISYTDASGDYGHYEQGVGTLYSGSTLGDYNELNFGSSSEVHFTGSTTLDNGLEVSFRAELELEDDSDVDYDADQIDEVYVQFDGGFGRVQFGQQDGVMDQMAVVSPMIFDGHNHQDISRGTMDPFSPIGVGNPISTVGDYSGDDIKLIYFTPSMNGFQLGFSYAPNPCKNDTGYSGCVYSEFARNYWEVSGSWEVDVNNVGFAFSGGYGQGESGSSSENPQEWTLGANMSFGGFTLGGSYRDTNTTGNSSWDEKHWEVGASYETGPWAFQLSYGRMDMDDGDPIFDNGFDGEAESWIGGLTYMYGPGMQIGLGVTTLDRETRDGGGGYYHWEGFDGTSVFLENSITF
jgi:predicted porin